MEPKVQHRFFTKVHQFSIRLSQIKTRKNINIELSNHTDDFLLRALDALYQEVIKTYDTNELYVQMDLSLPGLKTKWILEGPVKVGDGAEDLPGKIVGQLNTVLQSDESLIIDSQMKVNIFITEDPFTPGGEMYNFSSENEAQILFIKKISEGIVDLHLLDKSSDCLARHVVFGMNAKGKKLDDVLIKEINCPSQISAEMKVIISEKNSYFKKFEKLALLINCRISVFIRNENDFKFGFSTRNHSKTFELPLTLFYEENQFGGHISYIHNINLVDSKKWCHICLKSFSKKQSLMLHSTCLRKRCYQCTLLCSKNRLELKDPTGRDLCASKVIQNAVMKCNYCKLIFRNAQCYWRHVTHRETCKKYYFCEKCQTYFKKEKQAHICGQIFCKLCFSHHQKGYKKCYIKSSYEEFVNPKLKIESIFYLVILKHEDSFIKCCLKTDMNYTYTSCCAKEKYICECYEGVCECYEKLKNYDFSWNHVVGPIFEILLSKDGCNVVLCDDETLYNIEDYIGPSFVKYSGNKVVEVKYRNIILKSIPTFVQTTLLESAFQNDFSITSVMFPRHLLERIRNQNNEIKLFGINSFHLDEIIGTNEEMFLKLKSSALITLEEYKNLNPIEICRRIIKKRIELFIIIANKLQTMFNYILCQLLNSSTKKFDIFHFSSMTQIGHKLFRLLIPNDKIAILPPRSPKKHRNTSKYEILVSHLLIELHERCSGSKFSYINADGQQFIPKDCSISADFFCEGCQRAYFVDGLWKTVCKNHVQKLTKIVFGKTVEEHFKEAKVKREIFKNKCENDGFSKIIIKHFNQCCLMNSPQTELKEDILFFAGSSKLTYFLEKFNEFKKTYESQNYISLNPQDSTFSPIFQNYSKFVEIKNNSSQMKIQKYDLRSAFVSVLKDPNFKLPVGFSKRLVFKDAEKYVIENIKNKEMLEDVAIGVIKCCILPSSKTFFPFIPIKNKKNKSNANFLSNCKTCISEIKSSHSCNHSILQRQFTVTINSQDLHFCLHHLNYQLIDVFEIIYFESSEHFKSLAKTAYILTGGKDYNENIQNPYLQKYHETFGIFEKYWLKMICLYGLGRFSLNVASIKTEKKNGLSFLNSLQQKEIIKFNFWGNTCIVDLKRNFDLYNICVRLQTNALIFGLVSSHVRRKIISDANTLRNQTDTFIHRIDADSLTISCNTDTNFFQIIQNSKFLIYKEDPIKINRILNFSSRSFAITDVKSKTILKVTGLSLPIAERLELTEEKIDKKKKLIPRRKLESRFVNEKIENENIIYWIMLPFGSVV
ncbi:MAG TPA: hypothetical protein EYM70_03155 [Pelagibacteraceae bacterium]|nr:hypothetical protein [Pelagibacteraceae bacterium]